MDMMAGTGGAVFWLVVAVILFVIEGVSTELVSVWFAVGALVTSVVAYARGPFLFQLFMFLVVSVVVLLVGRPILKQKLYRPKEPTNADRVLGQLAVVTEEIDNVKQTGRVYVMDMSWMARSEFYQVIPADEKVVVKYIEGVKLIVSPVGDIGGGE